MKFLLDLSYRIFVDSAIHLGAEVPGFLDKSTKKIDYRQFGKVCRISLR